MPIIRYGNHTIEVKLDPKTGEETVLYDGQVMSSKISVGGATHRFTVREEGKDVTYEVKIGTRGLGGIKGIFMWPVRVPKVEVSRDGKQIYSS
jgi:hypothetical protein